MRQHNTPPYLSFVERRRGEQPSDKGMHIVKLFTGDYYVTNNSGEMIVTILGSCIAACMHDPVVRAGGMNHFLLPDMPDFNGISESSRYGVYAMEQLINGILKLGGLKSRLQVKIFGGANVISGSSMIGSRNVSFVRKFLRNEGISVINEDLGDNYPRRLRYFPDTGRAMLMKLKRKDDLAVVTHERRFAQTLAAQPIEGDIELF